MEITSYELDNRHRGRIPRAIKHFLQESNPSGGEQM